MLTIFSSNDLADQMKYRNQNRGSLVLEFQPQATYDAIT